MTARRLPLAALVALLAACNQSGRPRVVEVPQTYGAPPTSTAAAPAATSASLAASGEAYTVIPGDTVYGVAERFQVPIRSLIELNGLQPPYRLAAGSTLRIPAQREHVVQAGDTLYGISRQYGVDVSTLIRLNSIPSPYEISPGQRLLLPAPVEAHTVAGVTGSGGAAPASGVPSSSSSITVVELPPPDVAASPPDAAPAPSVPEPASGSAAAPAAEPQAPQSSTAGSTATETGSSAPPAPANPGAVPLPQPPPPSTAAAAPEMQTATVQPPPAEPPSVEPPGPVPQPAPLTAGQFLWPVNGKIVSAFGPKEGGLHNDGINIAAPLGTPVRAAENGVVAYAGNELRGFGNLLLIRHADGWMSAYAHNETLLVKRGDSVTRGQTIARVGQSGNVSSPQLHFELRRGAEAVDPLQYLGELGAALPPEFSPADGRGGPPAPG